jgi:hypothetical protein
VAGAIELEEAKDHNEEACVLKKPVEMSKSDSKERNQNKEKPGQKNSAGKTHQKIGREPKSREVFTNYYQI